MWKILVNFQAKNKEKQYEKSIEKGLHFTLVEFPSSKGDVLL
jgi:hypothetical protein